MSADSPENASRAARKLEAALDAFGVDPTGLVCADLGCSAGGFVDCLLRRGAVRVHAIDRGYGVLDYRLRRDPRVDVRERTDALRVHLPEPVDLVTIDVGWTRQRHILPAAMRLLAQAGSIITLIKPHYEAGPEGLLDGILPEDRHPGVLQAVRDLLPGLGLSCRGELRSPLPGRAGNVEYLWHLSPTSASA
ncbi:MAG: SAM-dependent methyltransferase [Phycisphaerae bacterium]